MVILYTAKKGVYINLNDISEEEKISGNLKVYVNLTNKCSCACTFCLRNTKEMKESNSLWLEREPTYDEIISEFKKYDITKFKEITFCGFGEPTMALDTLIKVAEHIKNKSANTPIRLNSNGLGDLVHEKEIAPFFEGLIDTISISLNSSNAEEFLKLTRNKYGLSSYDSMIRFAISCKSYIPNVVMTVVDCIGEKEIVACQTICDKIGVHLRVRPFE
ncbi:TatD family nuclease-associated radical SAM protein [Clostridium saccharoperbutylacetonicum]|uniref:TatD family nuclease-associated radical SAM protein n=1 Tax=Clostridium saccharoperbutylacetonicum TaxID=36745 RepID=UPI0039E7A13E